MSLVRREGFAPDSYDSSSPETDLFKAISGFSRVSGGVLFLETDLWC